MQNITFELKGDGIWGAEAGRKVTHWLHCRICEQRNL